MALQANQIANGTQTPVSAGDTNYWQKGDIVLNTSPAPGQVIGWECITAGYPGTWQPMGSNPLQLTANLTATQINGMQVTPVSLIAAPGVGFAIVVNNILFQMTTTATGFANGGAVSFVYTGGSVAVGASTVPAATITAGAGTTYTLIGPPVLANGTIVPSNTGVSITNAGAPFITGTGTAKIQIAYTIVTL